MDSDNYSGLTEVSSLEDWLFFSEDAVRNKEKYLRRQQKFLENLDLITNVQEVYANYRSLFQAREHYREGQKDNSSKERVVYVANDLVPTLQLSFLKPFNDDREKGLLDEMFILESDLNQKFNKEKDISVCSYLGKVLTEFNPTIIVFCRYSGPHCAFMRMWAKQRGIPTIYHIDDDLLSIPKDIGIKKYQYHNSAGRIKTVRYLLDHVDYIYCSTKNLTTRLEELGVSNTKQAGKIYCSGSVIEQAIQRETIKIGYMASADHAHNMQVVLPAIVKLLEKHPQVQFEFFGSIPTPIELQKFSGRISTAPPVRDYGSFLQEFSKRKWDVGICPLTPIPFNLMKANTKWIEYTSVGAAVVASRDTVYDDCCADECGLLASTPEEWFEHLDSLVTDANYRYKIVSNAQHKLINEYSEGHLKSQVLGVYKNARKNLLSREE